MPQYWQGWNVALKPAYEPIILAMKPRDGTFANNALVHGVAGLWIDGARVPTNGENLRSSHNVTIGGNGIYGGGVAATTGAMPGQGRWPANLILDEEAGRLLDAMSGETSQGHFPNGGKRTGTKTTSIYGHFNDSESPERFMGDTGGASRFFYCPKASRAERNAGLEGMPLVNDNFGTGGTKRLNDAAAKQARGRKPEATPPQQNHHPTVKPVALLEYLARLTKTPTGGVVADFFMGSGSTGVACVNEGRDFIGVEIDPGYFEIAQRRIAWAEGQAQQESQMVMAL